MGDEMMIQPDDDCEEHDEGWVIGFNLWGLLEQARDLISADSISPLERRLWLEAAESLSARMAEAVMEELEL